MLKVLLIGLLGALVTGCATVNVNAVGDVPNKELCIVEAPKVFAAFLVDYRSALERKGYKVKMLKSDADVDACETTSTYIARRGWDFAMYMKTANIKVYRDGRLAGEASFRKNTLNNRTKVIQDLVEKLFP